MKIYVEIDKAKNRFDYCTMDDGMNILYKRMAVATTRNHLIR